MLVLGVLGGCAAAVVGVGAVLRRRRRRDVELGLTGPRPVRRRGVGHLGEAPVYPHHRTGRL